MINKKVLKSLANGIFSMAVIFSFSNCSDSASKSDEQEVVKTDKSNILKAVINVRGMTCEGCETSIQTRVSEMEGVIGVKASHIDENTIVEYDKTQTSPQEIEKVISEIGYQIFQAEEKAQMKEAPQTMKCGEGKCGNAE